MPRYAEVHLSYKIAAYSVVADSILPIDGLRFTPPILVLSIAYFHDCASAGDSTHQ